MTTAVSRFAPEQFTPRPLAHPVFSQAEMIANIASHEAQVLDARAAGRFVGTDPEPRPGLHSGHIPGSLNLPFLGLIEGSSKTWKSPGTLKTAFAAAGVDFGRPVVTTCGSGVSACALALGAYLAGKPNVAIYDGSWMEWGADAHSPIESGVPRPARQ